MKLSEHFNSEEFTCKCGCGEHEVSPKLIALLEVIRKYTNAPVTIVSGRRCEKHNKACGGKTHSQHLLGNAADIQIMGMSPAKVQQFVQELHESNKSRVGGLGKYATFTHVDVRQTIARWNG